MLSLWAILTETDIEAYAGALVLPSYLAHLCLGPFKFADQAANADGRESLVLTYLGEGRLEEYALEPASHALAMIRFVAAGLDAQRIRLPMDDASWLWSDGEPLSPGLRVYFAPVASSLKKTLPGPIGQEAYVSVSRRHVFLGRSVVEAYVTAWLEHLGIAAPVSFEFGTPAGDIAFRADSIGGQLVLDDRTTVEDLLHFAGLAKLLAQLRPFVAMELDAALPNGGEIQENGIYLPLACRHEEQFELP
jgi:hypothetical protein